jgi:hypothetical protein
LTFRPDFGNPDGSDLYPEVGITGTPVIDLVSQTMYLDAFTHEGHVIRSPASCSEYSGR